MLDQIGTYFTPFLILMLGFIIVKGILVPIGKPAAPVVDNAFALGFTEGYQTMDALASMAFASIIMADIMGHGHGNTKEGLSMAVKVALVSMLGFLFVYGGLVYLGASGERASPIRRTGTPPSRSDSWTLSPATPADTPWPAP